MDWFWTAWNWLENNPWAFFLALVVIGQNAENNRLYRTCGELERRCNELSHRIRHLEGR